jgi:hypothetical protein
MFEQENEAYHYPKRKDGSRIGNTLCVLTRDGRIFIGEAVLSPNDQFSKKTGRKIAKGRAEASFQRYLEKKERLANGKSSEATGNSN